MLCLESPKDVTRQIQVWREGGRTIAFVPTMGNLHQGHLSLVENAKSVADLVVVSIYINPMQFGVGEDLDSYPRTLEADKKALEDLSVDLLFLPDNDAIYPGGEENSTQVRVPGLSTILCGEFRPEHFAGVTTVVNKLLNIVCPDTLVLGQKDFQQVFIIQKMLADLFMPMKVVSSRIIRENNGLAMSSRNQYLTEEQRQQATLVYQTLSGLKESAEQGDDLRRLEAGGAENLLISGFKVDYVSFRSVETLLPAERSDKQVVLLIAAWVGQTRLIDNLVFSLSEAI